MSVSATDAAFVRELVQRRAAIQLDSAKDYLIEMRLAPVVSEQGLASIAELVGRARNGAPGIETKIIEAITTHETSFYRDLHPFESLQRSVLPELLAKRDPVRPLTVWCAACSSGQEPYSIAMLLLERFPQALNGAVKIYATDISERILARARSGLFTQLEVNRGLPAAQLVKYFDREVAEWRLREVVRKMVEFRALNLLEFHTYPMRVEIVLIRNVLIYFDLPTKRKILDRIRQILVPGGALILGAAETTLNVADGWDRVVDGKHAYYKAKS